MRLDTLNARVLPQLSEWVVGAAAEKNIDVVALQACDINAQKAISVVASFQSKGWHLVPPNAMGQGNCVYEHRVAAAWRGMQSNVYISWAHRPPALFLQPTSKATLDGESMKRRWQPLGGETRGGP